jgi:hypothetical protein
MAPSENKKEEVTRERVINGNYIVFFSDKKLNSILQQDIFSYEYELGTNIVTLSINEYDDIKYLKVLDKYFKKYVDITVYVSKNPIGSDPDKKKENYYSIMFKRCKLNKIFNDGTCGSMESSAMDITFSYNDYEIRY